MPTTEHVCKTYSNYSVYERQVWASIKFTATIASPVYSPLNSDPFPYVSIWESSDKNIKLSQVVLRGVSNKNAHPSGPSLLTCTKKPLAVHLENSADQHCVSFFFFFDDKFLKEGMNHFHQC